MRFDIILPTVNRPSLELAIKSIYAQRHTDWMLYVVGDGVTPNYEETDSGKIMLVSMECTNNSGASQRNFGINLGTSPWIAYLDDDDVWMPDHLSTIVELAQQNPNANMFKTGAQEMVRTRKSPRHPKNEMKLRCINLDDPLTITIAHSRDLFLKTSRWQPVDNHDHLLFKEMLSVGGVLAKSDNITALYLR